MEQRRVYGKNHWYHETQSTICPVDVLPLSLKPPMSKIVFSSISRYLKICLRRMRAGWHPPDGWLMPCFLLL